ncbi:MAG: hypothetical protein H6621_08700 [Halobacteriovoraceae bacterium]|nr:hypothetical protein [Halobacteriovoraceae bacterium]MCB9095132.1 hypothetical protein [Halobacteriovoraceae bacterium]
MKKTALLSVLLFYSLGQAWAKSKCPRVSLPSNFTARERILSLATTIDIDGDNIEWGMIEKENREDGQVVFHYSYNGIEVAYARGHVNFDGGELEIFDCEDNKLGILKETITKEKQSSQNKVQYKLSNKEGIEISQTLKKKLDVTDFQLEYNKEQTIRIWRPWTWLNDNWNIEWNNNSGLDSRLFIFIPAYRTHADDIRQKQ